ncbi:virion-associated protein [Agrobacterium phage Milano]|uniref:Virion-associated protein n=1 Tax=Agrobacterium phage Milano TaxID=2557550 RepID=A0ACD6BA89_9CAUD|nr:Chain AQ, Tail-terminator protein, gp18 [Agrobacterium phage Milano]8FWE_AR Chain AR, Tail-terminator protein, gp18 [Agrobacterium phage Milano]8FWE_AS Chain AS, Tail-terminator protein, gp18 [Agrobacterium phage Milano]8FWE_AT Chain AT, Tail-terminator protein, gp18 [Agrobacterium phage Milano]8FWE_AW Chain AW, Tail-terminator protein, gp18 [Agrobacterium phage Milano]8FWE_AX Chain AX, Tail-terminator protein, gp18 [Agrobacterium phage Milano]8FWM_AS Chain AS, Tail-terminator protein, gp1
METKLTYGNRVTLPEFAKYIVAPAFHEIEGRAIPVTGVDDDASGTQATKLPFVLVGLRQGDTSGPATIAGNSTINLRDDFIVEFNMKKERYRDRKGGETPFFSYYDYESIRDRLFNSMIEFSGEHGITFEFVSLDISTEGDVVYIEFRFRQNYEWCETVREADTTIEAGRFSINLQGC